MKSNISKMDRKPDRHYKPRVLVDLDGVIRDFVGSLIRVYNRIYPEHRVLPIDSRRLEDFFPAGEDVYKLLEPGAVEEIMEQAPAYPGAIEALHRWKDEFEIVVVTAQPDLIKAATFIWIGKNNIPTNEVHISYFKSEIEGIALLDDFIDNLQEYSDTGRLAICLDQPWNRSWKGIRVKTVNEFFEKIQALIQGNHVSEITQQNIT